MTTIQSVESFLSEQSLALLGASSSGKKFGNTVLKELSAKGWEITPIHPQVNEIDGHATVASLADLDKQITAAILVIPPQESEKVIPEAARAGLKKLWLQQGASSPDAARLCEDHDIEAIHDECILMFAEPHGIHKFHNWLWGLFGKLPER